MPDASSSTALRDTATLPRLQFELDYADFNFLFQETLRLRTGLISICEPGRNAGTPYEINLESALDALHHAAFDIFMILVSLAQPLPTTGPALRRRGTLGVTVLVLETLDQHVNFVAAFDGKITLSIQKLFARDHHLRTYIRYRRGHSVRRCRLQCPGQSRPPVATQHSLFSRLEHRAEILRAALFAVGLLFTNGAVAASLLSGCSDVGADACAVAAVTILF